MPTLAEQRGGRGRWAGVPADDRRVERRRLLLDAGFELLGTDGWSGTTVRAVCQAARLNPRYFYESFEDLDALAVAVYERVVGELRVQLGRALDGSPPDLSAQMRAAVEATVAFVDDDRKRAGVLYTEAIGNEALNRRRITAGYDITAFIERDAVERRGPAPAGERIGSLTAAVLVGGMSEVLVAWLDGRIDMSREQLIDDVTELFLGLSESAARVASRRKERSALRDRPDRADSEGQKGD